MAKSAACVVCCGLLLHVLLLALVCAEPNGNSIINFGTFASNQGKYIPHTYYLKTGLSQRNVVGKTNLGVYLHKGRTPGFSDKRPGDPAPAFTVPTLSGTIKYPGSIINRTTPVLFFSHDEKSAFSQCLWHCTHSIEDLLLNIPQNTHIMFLINSNISDTKSQVILMQNKVLEKEESLIATGR